MTRDLPTKAMAGDATVALASSAQEPVASSFRTSKIRDQHRERMAIVYVRQSTPQQVIENQESALRQYDLAAHAKALGWSPQHVLVIDEDQGQSGRSAEHRAGFQRLLTEVTLEHVGLVLGLPQAQAVGAPPRDAALAGDILEVADQQHAKVHARRQAGLAPFFFRGVIRFAAAFDPTIEVGLGQQLVEFLIERMPIGLGQRFGHHEQGLLPLLPLAHRHRRNLRVDRKSARRYLTTAVKCPLAAALVPSCRSHGNTSTDC
jgi:hypothetical protein